MKHKIIGKYIKELKFNIPNPKTFFLLAKDIANYKINIDIKSVQIKQSIIEVLTSLKLSPVKEDFEKIDTKIIFSTIVEFNNENLAKDEMEKTILVDIPNPKIFFLLAKDIANYKINIDIKSIQVKQNIIEVLTSLKLSPTKDDFEKIDTKIVFSTIVEFSKENLAKEEMEKTILVDIPSKIYPELRQIFIFLFENSGFKEIKINETVDFEKLYKMRKVQ